MGKCIFFLVLVDFGIHGTYSKELKGLTYIYCSILYYFCTETTTILENYATISWNINIHRLCLTLLERFILCLNSFDANYFHIQVKEGCNIQTSVIVLYIKMLLLWVIFPGIKRAGFRSKHMVSYLLSRISWVLCIQIR
jgi:hypothetical protein